MQQDLQHAVAHAHPGGGNRRTTEVTKKVVVSPPAADGAQLPDNVVDLEHHAGVVGQTSHDGRIEHAVLGHAHQLQRRKHTLHLLDGARISPFRGTTRSIR